MKQTYYAIVEYKDDDTCWEKIVTKTYQRESAMWDKIYCIKRSLCFDRIEVKVVTSTYYPTSPLELETTYRGDMAILSKCHEFGSVDRCYNR